VLNLVGASCVVIRWATYRGMRRRRPCRSSSTRSNPMMCISRLIWQGNPEVRYIKAHITEILISLFAHCDSKNVRAPHLKVRIILSPHPRSWIILYVGFGLLRFNSVEQAQAAIAQVHGSEVGGRRIQVGRSSGLKQSPSYGVSVGIRNANAPSPRTSTGVEISYWP
jgi:hypothetical protein